MPEAPFFTPELKPREFALIRDFAFSTFGLELRQGKEKLVSARLGKHLRAGGFQSFEEYFRHVQSDKTGDALVSLIDALTTNHTSFLRETEHFRFMREVILPRFRGKSLSIWSAACSTGEEPYSILLTAVDAFKPALADVRIVATDISSRVLSAAKSGKYTLDKLAGLPPGWLGTYFDKVAGVTPTTYQVRSEYRSKIDFRRLNLMEPLPANQRFPLIFCRNVMIYFNKATQESLVSRLTQSLEPGGYLFTGHAESLTGISHPLTYIRPAIYQRNK